MGDAGGVGWVVLAGAAGIEQAGAGGKGGGHVNDVFAVGGQQLGDPAAEAVGAFNGEASLRPTPSPTH
jgi:hypothetical protein